VVVMERTNLRHLDGLPEPVTLVTLDLSFISVLKVKTQARGRWVWFQRVGFQRVGFQRVGFQGLRSSVEPCSLKPLLLEPAR